jgi:molecular chaperone GrpE
MDPNKENTDYSFEMTDEVNGDETGSVDDFIRELEAKEKDLHITSETTFIEIAADFEEDEIPDFIRKEIPPAARAVKPAAAPGAAGPDVRKLQNEVAELKAKIAGLEDQRKELYENSKRRSKDFESYKARTERERSETFQRQLSNLATQMLPALDNLDRALQCTPYSADEKNSEFAHFYDGVVLVNQQVNEVLAGMGIVPIATVGEEFDPHLHEAVAVDEDSDQPHNTITAELLRGFRIGDKVIRHSMVKVAKSAAPADTNQNVSNGVDAPDEDDSEVGEDTLEMEFETTASTVDDDEFVIERNGEVTAGEDDE